MPPKKDNTNVPVIPENMVLIEKAQLMELIEQNETLKQDIGVFVRVFSGLQGLFKGTVSLVSIIPVVTKLMSDKSKMAELSLLGPVMDKYTNNPENDVREGN